MVLTIPGARSRKDRRQAVRSLRDRVRHRFEVAFCEIDDQERPGSQTVAIATIGNNPVLIRSILDKIVAFAQSSGSTWPAEVDVDVFRWHSRERGWALNALASGLEDDYADD
ncbi:MAG: DUF503 domain-containing protein [Proteobacteria bacterium]|jgi:uncharacterized protein|nr:DUF503 domain-containing protein [Pseudomonadota bacterium]